MASREVGVEVIPTPDGKRLLSEGRYSNGRDLPSKYQQWRIDRRVKGQRVRTKVHPTLEAARTEFRELERQARNGVRMDKASRAVTFGELSAQWLERREARMKVGAIKRSTYEDECLHVRTYLLPAFEHHPLKAITTAEVEQWRANLTRQDGKPLAESSRVKATVRLQAVLDAAVDEGLIERSPMKSRSGRNAIARGRRQQTANVYLTGAQLLRLADVIDPHYRTLVLVAGTCGPRIGELMGLHPEDVNEVQSTVHIARSVDEHGDETATKTYEARTVAVPRTLMRDLAALAHETAPGSRIFTTAKGKQLDKNNFRDRSFKPAVAVASTAVARLQRLLGVSDDHSGIYGAHTVRAIENLQRTHGLAVTGECGPETWSAVIDAHLAQRTPSRERKGEHTRETLELKRLQRCTLRPGDQDFTNAVRFHDLRHTAASLAISTGANVKAVQTMLGHKTATVTLDTYAGLFDTDRDRVAEGIASAVFVPHSPQSSPQEPEAAESPPLHLVK